MTTNVLDYKSIVYTLLPEISEGKYNDYNRFPTESELCERFNVNRSTIREALKVLQFLNLISSSQGSRYRVTKDFNVSFEETLSTLLSFQKFTYKDISDIREALEIKSLLLIQQRQISNNDKKKFVECIEKMKNKDSAIAADYEFHKLMSKLSGNQLIVDILAALSNVNQKYIEFPWNTIDHDETNELIYKHEQIVKALDKKESIIKENSISNHYAYVNKIMEERHILFSKPELLKKSIPELINLGYTMEEIVGLAKEIKDSINNDTLK